MAYAKLTLENPNTGHIRTAPVGFSWTVAFLGFFPPLIRGDLKWGIVMLVLTFMTWGLNNLVFMFIYNKLYIKDLINSGYKVSSVDKGEVGEISQKLNLELPILNSITSDKNIDSTIKDTNEKQ